MIMGTNESFDDGANDGSIALQRDDRRIGLPIANNLRQSTQLEQRGIRQQVDALYGSQAFAGENLAFNGGPHGCCSSLRTGFAAAGTNRGDGKITPLRASASKGVMR